MSLPRARTRAELLLFLFVTVKSALPAMEVSLAPDIVIINASIHTMDESRPTASAVAIAGNHIAAVGSSAEIRALAQAKTRLIDAGQKVVLPGFNDAHVHFLSGGFALSNVNLREAKSATELAAQLGAYAKTVPKGAWILGGDWDHEKWPGSPLPTKEIIDAATTNHPVFVNRLDGHMALANSVALKLAAINKETQDPSGGIIMRDPQTGEPTGILKDAAERLVQRVIPDRT